LTSLLTDCSMTFTPDGRALSAETLSVILRRNLQLNSGYNLVQRLGIRSDE
jgi:hypothetical protein